jgi:hypothetical protein
VADRILQAVSIRRELIQGVGTQDELHDLIAKFAKATLYDTTKLAANGRTVKRLTRDIARVMTQRFLPDAQKVAKASAEPILDRLGGTKLVDKANILRGDVLKRFNLYHKKNLMAFHSELRMEAKGLGSEIEAAFARAYRDGTAHKQLVTDLVQSHKDEMERIRVVRDEIKDSWEKYHDAEARLAKASKRKMARARREVRKARKVAKAAEHKIGTAKDFLGRFETRVQGHARDAIRREAEAAQTAHFQQAGYHTFTWIAVNSGEACPQCEARHGRTYTDAQAKSDGPGKGGTYCGDSCMCLLVPKDYHKQAKGVEKPLSLGGQAPSPKPTPAAPKFKPAKTAQEAEAWAKKNGLAASVDYSKTDTATANLINETLMEAKGRGEGFDAILPLHKASKIAGRKYNMRSVFTVFTGRDVQTGQWSYKMLGYNETHVASVESLKGAASQLRKSGLILDTSPRGLITHEYGHLVDQVHGSKWGGASLNLSEKMAQAFDDPLFARSAINRQMAVSGRYFDTNSAEQFAEIFRLHREGKLIDELKPIGEWVAGFNK